MRCYIQSLRSITCLVPRYKSGITWFDDDAFIGSEISFPGSASRWKLERKVTERESCQTEEDVKTAGFVSEGRAVFSASNVEGSFPEKEVIIKIKMQVPWWSTASKSPTIRAEQATEKLSNMTANEIKALDLLTKAGCSSSPILYPWHQDKQNDELWVPCGHITYILMEKLLGTEINGFFNDLDRKERDELRAAFKEAWLECVDCGIIHGDSAVPNILWDRENKKCYLIDFELYYSARSDDKWDGSIYSLIPTVCLSRCIISPPVLADQCVTNHADDCT